MVSSSELWSTTRTSSQARSESSKRPIRRASFSVCTIAVILGMVLLEMRPGQHEAPPRTLYRVVRIPRIGVLHVLGHAAGAAVARRRRDRDRLLEAEIQDRLRRDVDLL